MTRAEHLEWCKARALEYVAIGDWQQAMTSMMSDLGKHPETEGHSGITLGAMLMFSGKIRDAGEARRFIEGFN